MHLGFNLHPPALRGRVEPQRGEGPARQSADPPTGKTPTGKTRGGVKAKPTPAVLWKRTTTAPTDWLLVRCLSEPMAGCGASSRRPRVPPLASARQFTAGSAPLTRTLRGEAPHPGPRLTVGHVIAIRHAPVPGLTGERLNGRCCRQLAGYFSVPRLSESCPPEKHDSDRGTVLNPNIPCDLLTRDPTPAT